MFLFPDTHLFLHFKDPRELPWSDVTACDTVTLVVARTVQKELEKKKFELRGRAQDRARKYARALAAIVTEQKPRVLREAGPRVILDFVGRPPGWSAPADLAPEWQDDQLVADVLAFQSQRPAESAAILSGDAGVIATARAHGLTVMSPPDSGWELPAESTSEEKELQKLRQQNAEFRRSGPAIEAELWSDLDERLQAATFSTVWHPRLSEEQTGLLVQEVLAANPVVELFDHLPDEAEPSEWELPTEGAIDSYKAEYEKWRGSVRPFIYAARPDVRDHPAYFPLQVRLSNSGVEPAMNARVRFEVTGGFHLAYDPPGETAEDEEPGLTGDLFRDAKPLGRPLRAPRPKKRPKSSVLTIGGSVGGGGLFDRINRQQSAMGKLGLADSRLSALMGRGVLPDAIGRAVAEPMALPMLTRIPPRRDPHEFYWVTSFDDRDGASVWEYECAEYPHQTAPEVFSLKIGATIAGAGQREGLLKVRVQARNLRAPLEASYNLKLVVAEADTVARVRALLPL